MVAMRAATIALCLGLVIALLGATPCLRRSCDAAPAPPPQIRVVLGDAAATQTVGGKLAWVLGGKVVARSTEPVKVVLSDKAKQELTAEIGGRKLRVQRLRAEALEGYVRCGGSDYRGALELFAGKEGGVVVLNVLPLEDYLLSVVPSEMPSAWPAEALRAQAVAARSYALARMAAQRDGTYDVFAGPASQEYRGVGGEHETSTQAVRDTAGQVLTYNGQPITAYYCADAGGYTKAGEQPYLKAVPSFCPKSPHNDWSVPLSNEKLAALAKGEGHDVGQVLSVDAANDSHSGHLVSITIHGERGACLIKAAHLRNLLGLSKMKSTRLHLESPGGASLLAAPAFCPAPDEPAPVRGLPRWLSVSLQGFSRPWVAWISGNAALKMRTLYAFDGTKLVRCNRETAVVSGAANLPAAAEGAPPVAASASALDGVVLRGSGYGHGLGMSQWGARQLAEEGKSYKEILTYFYQGVELVNWAGGAVQVPPQLKGEENNSFYVPFESGR